VVHCLLVGHHISKGQAVADRCRNVLLVHVPLEWRGGLCDFVARVGHGDASFGGFGGYGCEQAELVYCNLTGSDSLYNIDIMIN
jgi:hypothetical protein